jgi:hypothetical protein
LRSTGFAVRQAVYPLWSVDAGEVEHNAAADVSTYRDSEG